LDSVLDSITIHLADADRAIIAKDSRSVSTVIISYDGTPNDDDALALGKRLAATGATLALAYVRHSREFDPSREELAQHDAEQRLARGAELLGDPGVKQHVVVGPSTAEVLGQLAESEGASAIVFGSDYRTPPGHSEPGNTAQHLLEGGVVAIGVAPAGLRTQIDGAIKSIAVPLAGPRNDAARTTADALADKLGASVVDPGTPDVDLIVVGSQPEAPAGRILLGGAERSELNRARSSVLVLPAGSPLRL
jgi:nucleotide-binding universal stress UspA family protein